LAMSCEAEKDQRPSDKLARTQELWTSQGQYTNRF
jgi:hypothetical protein